MKNNDYHSLFREVFHYRINFDLLARQNAKVPKRKAHHLRDSLADCLRAEVKPPVEAAAFPLFHAVGKETLKDTKVPFS